MKNSRLNIKTPQKKTKKDKLVFVRSGMFHGITIERSKAETATINRGIVSIPNIVFYSNNTKCIIDYTNQTNDSISEIVTNYFNQLTPGNTFSIFNGEYTDTNSDVVADISGQYIFRSHINGIIKADVSTVDSLSTTISRYDKTRFDKIPYLIANSITDDVTFKTIVKNKLGKNTKSSFNYLGLKVGDYITFKDQEVPVKVLESKIDSDGSEYLLVEGTIDEADLTGKGTRVNLYFIVSDDYDIEPDVNETDVGACLEYFNGVVISCTDNHTVSQCRMRADKGITTEITPGTFCATPETETALQSNVTENLVQVTTALVNAVTNVSNVSGPILKGTNSKNSFYGRPF
jgi:hypothetical protein